MLVKKFIAFGAAASDQKPLNVLLERKGAMAKIKLGFALTGSFCTFSEVIPVVQELVALEYDVLPIMSEFAYTTDTRFGKASEFAQQLELITGNKLVHSIVEAEPIGPKKIMDALIIAPCTGNTLAKISTGVNDTCITMASKSVLRNQKPLLIAVSTNDALANSAKNIGVLLNAKNVYFIPMKQDDPQSKPRSIVADFRMIPQAVKKALKNEQIQPIYL